jgi:hypothetical protein
VDDGSNVNIMLKSTMLHLGLSIIEPSPSKVQLVDQRPLKTLGQIEDFHICAGDEDYKITFYILHMHDKNGDYFLVGNGFN